MSGGDSGTDSIQSRDQSRERGARQGAFLRSSRSRALRGIGVVVGQILQ